MLLDFENSRANLKVKSRLAVLKVDVKEPMSGIIRKMLWYFITAI